MPQAPLSCPTREGAMASSAASTRRRPLCRLSTSWKRRTARHDPEFAAQISQLARDYVGRPTPLYFARNLTDYAGGAGIFLKREDLAHNGAHKINNALGQGLLAARMGKQRVIAETGAGQH